MRAPKSGKKSPRSCGKKRKKMEERKTEIFCRRQPLKNGKTSSLCGRFGGNCLVSPLTRVSTYIFTHSRALAPPSPRPTTATSSTSGRGGGSAYTFVLRNGKLKLPFIAIQVYMRFAGRLSTTRNPFHYNVYTHVYITIACTPRLPLIRCTRKCIR